MHFFKTRSTYSLPIFVPRFSYWMVGKKKLLNVGGKINELLMKCYSGYKNIYDDLCSLHEYGA